MGFYKSTPKHSLVFPYKVPYNDTNNKKRDGLLGFSEMLIFYIKTFSYNMNWDKYFPLDLFRRTRFRRIAEPIIYKDINKNLG